MISIDVHSITAQGLFRIPVISLSPAELFAQEIKRLSLLTATIVAPDEGARGRSRAVARAAWTYAVNPTNTNSIYEIVGLPGTVAGGPYQAELFKSVDGGTTWQPVLKQLPVIPIAPKIFVGSENSNFVYLTNTRCPSAQAFRAGVGLLFQSLAGGAFSVCMSSDGGVHWQTISAPSQLAASMSGGVVDPQGRLYTQTPSTPGSVMDIWRYDPTVQIWSKVTTAPMEESLLTVTPSAIHEHAALWLMGTAQEKSVLYRYVV